MLNIYAQIQSVYLFISHQMHLLRAVPRIAGQILRINSFSNFVMPLSVFLFV